MSARHLRRGTHRRDVELAQPEQHQACRVVGAVGRVPQVRCAQSLGSVGRNDRPAHNPADDAAGTCLYQRVLQARSACSQCGGVRVALIEPGQINTPLLTKSSHDIAAKQQPVSSIKLQAVSAADIRA
jgi:hypothetical protein